MSDIKHPERAVIPEPVMPWRFAAEAWSVLSRVKGCG